MKWANYIAYSCTWEPEDNLPENLLSEFKFPTSPPPGLSVARDEFIATCQARLGQRTANHFYMPFHHDVFRFLLSGKGVVCEGGKTLYTKTDLDTFDLPKDWDKLIYTEKGEGRIIVFPILLCPVLRWSKNTSSKLQRVY